jgi:hypothetical protein
VNKTRIILILYPLFALASLWFTKALVTEHLPVWRARDWRSGGIAVVIYCAILVWLLSRARRDRVLDRTLAVGGLVLSLLPFVGAPVATFFSLWLAWDLRRV